MPLHFQDLFAAAAVGERALACGYRGARFLAPENTLPAVMRAQAAGTDFWELDVVLTAYDQIIVIHDDTLMRTANAGQVNPDRPPSAFHESILADIRQLDFGLWIVDQDPHHQLVAGVLSAAEGRAYTGRMVPTLEEVLAITRDQAWP
jgi:glycerophosphoryl diester phosphodiesterase